MSRSAGVSFLFFQRCGENMVRDPPPLTPRGAGERELVR